MHASSEVTGVERVHRIGDVRPAIASVIAVVVLASCSVRPESVGTYPVGSVLERPPSTATATTTSPSVSSPRSTSSSTVATSAALQSLQTEAADIALTVIREKRAGDPIETLLTGSGRIEPAVGHGHVRYDLRGLLPSAAGSPAPGALNEVELIWTETDLFVRPTGAPASEWERRTRDDGRSSGGLIGRLPDEVLGLMRLVSASGAGTTTRLGPAVLDAVAADRWVVTVPAAAAAAEGVPAEFPHADVIRRVYGLDEIDVEVWLVNAAVRRLRLVFERAQAPYGGPDRTTTTYDWQGAPDAIPIEIPT